MRFVTVALIVVMLSGLAVLDTSMDKSRPPSDTGQSVAVALAGQFRTVIANLLWIKLENYHHEFIAHNSDWTQNRDAMGLSRLITKMDPHFPEAYACGGRMLSGNHREHEAIAFLEEGIKNNPNSILLHDELATLLARHVKDYDGALFHFERAYVLAKGDEFDRRRLMRLIHTVKGLKSDAEKSAKSAESSSFPSETTKSSQSSIIH